MICWPVAAGPLIKLHPLSSLGHRTVRRKFNQTMALWDSSIDPVSKGLDTG
jgi:hypothetical protein